MNVKPNMTVILLALMMVLVPAVGVPHEELLQDTLKSMVVSFFALAAAIAFFWPYRLNGFRFRLHWIQLLPTGLLIYALGSMAWSHTYLAAVESVRWFVFSLILFLGLNSLTLKRINWLAWGIHIGAVLASLWATWQFWFDWPYFAQGPAPASSFLNRNFLAEFLVCTLPYSVLLLTRLQDKTSVMLLTFSLGWNIVALMMTGTRSALIGLVILLILLPVITLLYRRQCVSSGWKTPHFAGFIAVLAITVLGLGSLPTAHHQLVKEFGSVNAIERAFSRTMSIAQTQEYSSGSIAVRLQLWRATAQMIAAHPIAGVGAGAWEVQIPLYQDHDTQKETDFYAHSEFLQLLAEYGLMGWFFIALLLLYLCRSALKTWTDQSTQGQREAPLRAFTLASLLVLMVVSGSEFPWRMASTGAMFALSLAVLAASDARLGTSYQPWIHCKSTHVITALCLTAVCIGQAIYIAQQAIECESKLVRASKLALSIAASGTSQDPRWNAPKTQMLELLQQGIAINPHYRKLTPLAADAMLTWGDWKNATWVWESVLASRPYIVGMLANAARGHIQAKEFDLAQDRLNRALQIQPEAASLASVQIMLWSRSGHIAQAMQQAQSLLDSGFLDYDLLQSAYYLGTRHQNPALAIQALKLGIQTWPHRAVDGWLKLGHIYASAQVQDETQALQAYQEAINACSPEFRSSVLAMITPNYRARISLP